MSVFSKSMINSLVASLFVIHGPLYADEAEFVTVEKEVQEEKAAKKAIERRIEVKAKAGKPVRVFVNSNNQEHFFELSPEEIKNISKVTAKLEHLDEKTMAKVKQALANVEKSIAELKKEKGLLSEIEVKEIEELAGLRGKELRIKMLELDKMGKLHRTESETLENELKELHVLNELMDEEHAFVIRERLNEHGESITVNIEELDDEDKRVFVIDGSDGEIVINGEKGKKMVQTFVLGEGNTMMKGHVDAILKLIKHGEFSPEELDKLQQMLDSKR